MEIEVGQRAPIARLTFPDDRGLVAAGGADVAIETVRADVELAADEPFGVRRLPVEDPGPRLDPLELSGEAGPERFGIGGRARVDLRVVRERVLAPVGGGREDARLVEERVNFRGGHVSVKTCVSVLQHEANEGNEAHEEDLGVLETLLAAALASPSHCHRLCFSENRARSSSWTSRPSLASCRKTRQ
jgi:hypothetical protein